MTRDSSSTSNLRIAIDIGGTFTDLVLLKHERVIETAKVPTTPEDPVIGVIDGIERLLTFHDRQNVIEAVHGTTLVSNALIERKGATTALITTAGFRDVLESGREQRYDLYDLFLDLPQPLVPRHRRVEVSERVLSDGQVDTALDREDVVDALKRTLALGAKAAAVCFLHSYAAPDHEQFVREVAANEFPGLSVTLSSDVSPEIGEYHRVSTTVANAYVLPLIDRYLNLMEERIQQLGLHAPLRVMLSTGGLTTPDVAKTVPVRLVESGPAAGVIGAGYLGGASESRPVIAFDMGGTTAKAALVESREPQLTNELEVARVYRFKRGSGLPLRIPVVDMIEIGAGGGSIARVGPFDLPEVGPDSASAVPGPASYDLGGSLPTVTDADLILGYLNPTYFLGGRIELSVDRALSALHELGDRMGLSTEEAAAAVHRVVNENMASATRMHAIERGRDLGRFSLVATGGAGPVHAWGVARVLGVEQIIFPPRAGVASAFGLLAAPSSFEHARSIPALLSDVDWEMVRRAVSEMEETSRVQIERAGIFNTQTALFVDARYQGQGAWITVPLGSTLGDKPVAYVAAAFESEYRRLYGSTPEHVTPEVLTWRVRVGGPPPSPRIAAQLEEKAPESRGQRPVWFAETGFVETEVLNRYTLAPGFEFEGPAVIEERESTVVVGPFGSGKVDNIGNIVVRLIKAHD